MSNEKLEAEVSKIKEAAEEVGQSLYINNDLSPKSYTILNEDTLKAVLIGPVEINEDISLVAFKINIHKYKWASEEGFSRDQVLGELAKDIFEMIPTKDIISYLLQDE